MNMAEDIEVKPIRNDLEVVAFRVSGQDFCFDLTSVREIRGWTDVRSKQKS